MRRPHAGEGHYICIICGRYIRPERKQQIADYRNVKAHKTCIPK